MLAYIRASLGKTPRKLHPRHKLHAPKWSLKGDRLSDIYSQQDKLLREGEVVWGALVQANRQLFADGPENHPGNVIYSLDPASFSMPGVLMAAAHQLFSVKGDKDVSAEMQVFSQTLADELERLMKVKVPGELTHGLETFFTSVMFDRLHLPDGVLRGGLMPMLAHPKLDATMVVPYWHWPDAFRDACW